MKAFFDTNVYINTFFRPILPHESFEKYFSIYEIWLCPIVKHELLLGSIHAKTRKTLEHFFRQCPSFEAPSAEAWEKTTFLMKQFNWRENRQQNDVLIALTAQTEEATLITYDKIFIGLQKELGFQLIHLEENNH